MTERSLRDPSCSDGPLDAGSRRKPKRCPDLGALNDHLGYFVRRLQIWIFQDFERALARYNIRPAQYSVLVVIEANPGLSQAELADALGIQRTRLVLLLDDLERRGLIRRLRVASDRRYHALGLTRQGEKKLQRMKSLAVVHEARVEKALGPGNRSMLIETLREFNALQSR